MKYIFNCEVDISAMKALEKFLTLPASQKDAMLSYQKLNSTKAISYYVKRNKSSISISINGEWELKC